MNQQEVSRQTAARLRAERETATDPDVIAGLDYHIRLHMDLAGPEDIPEDVAKPAKVKTKAAEAQE